MHHYPSVRKAIGAAEKTFEYMDRQPEIPPDGHLEPQNLRGHIQFKNVSFSYSGKTDANSLVLKVCTVASCAYVVGIFTGVAVRVSSPFPSLLLGRVL